MATGKQFFPSSAFAAKLESSILELSKTLDLMLVNDLQKLSLQDGCQDMLLLIVTEDIMLRHRFILKALCPALYDLFCSDENHSKNGAVPHWTLDKFPSCVSHTDKQLLRMISGKYFSTDSDYVGVDLTDLKTKMKDLFTEGDLSDVIFSMDRQEYRCHRCFIACRSRYFEAMFSGHWSETGSATVHLEGFSARSFELLLKYLYTACPDLPLEADVAELLIMADMYDVRGFSKVVSCHVRAHFCHFFHQPCPHCVSGVLQAVSLAERVKLDEIVFDAMRWFVKYYAKIFPTREFAVASTELRSRILSDLKASVNVANLIQHLRDTGKLLSTLSALKWAAPVRVLTEELQTHSFQFLADNFKAFLISPAFNVMLLSDENAGWKNDWLFESTLTAIQASLGLTNCLGIFVASDKMLGEIRLPEASRDFLSKITGFSVRYIRQNLVKISKTDEWHGLTKHHQDVIKADSGFVDLKDISERKSKVYRFGDKK